MGKNEFQELCARLDARLAAMSEDRAKEMTRVFELLSASFANEECRPSILIHGIGHNVIVLAVNAAPLEALELMSMAYMQMHDNVIGEVPSKGELH